MFVVNNEDQSIFCTRGDIGVIDINLSKADGESFIFSSGDIVRFRVMEKNHCDKIVLLKDVEITEATSSVQIHLSKEDTRIGDVINKPVIYWYELELNPETKPQTFVGYDEKGAKIFKLFPEGSDD